jgi:anti-anti-sigma factor
VVGKPEDNRTVLVFDTQDRSPQRKPGMLDEFRLSEVETPRGSKVIRVHGELNAETTIELVRRCEEIRSESKSLVLNLAEVTSIAPNGIGGLLAMVESFRDDGLSVRLAEVSAAVESVIKILNLDRFLAMDLTEKAALAALDA